MRYNPDHVSREIGPDGLEHMYVNGALAIRIFVIFALAYVMSYAFRAINAVIAQPLVAELGLSASQLGFLASAYFLSFAVMQLPVGVMLDRYGPRRVEAVLIGFAALGAVLFAVAESYTVLWLGRALIGVGVSACLMAAVKAYSLYFRPHMQASLSSWMLVAGSMGALTVTTPVEAALPSLGWRGVFGLAAVLCVLAGLALWFVLPKLFKPQKTESVGDMAQGYRAIYAHPHFWRVAPLAMITQGGFMAFHGLWVGPWFTNVIGLSNAQAAQNMFWISAVLMAGYLALGFLTRRVSKAGGDEDQIMLIGMGLSLVVFAVQIVQGAQSGLWGWLVHAFLISSGIMTYATCNKPFPKKLTGRSSTALNLLIFIGAFSIQWGIGVGIDAFVAAGFTSTDAMRLSLAALWVVQLGSWLWYARPGRKTSHLISLSDLRY
ncbi:MFS transporter [Limnobacter sp.]|uniref:MFS transporter n=1 Tax=Limnobacter sp. TaxID=2003368 RepID=UPI002FE24AAA